MARQEDVLPDVFGERGDTDAVRLELEREQLKAATDCPEAVLYLTRLLQRMGVASPLGATEAEAAMRNFGLEMLGDIGAANPVAHRQIILSLFENDLEVANE